MPMPKTLFPLLSLGSTSFSRALGRSGFVSRPFFSARILTDLVILFLQFHPRSYHNLRLVAGEVILISDLCAMLDLAFIRSLGVRLSVGSQEPEHREGIYVMLSRS